MKYTTILIFLALSACAGKQEKEEAPKTDQKATNLVLLTEAQEKNAEIRTGQLQRRPVSSILKVNGAIDVPPQNMVSISVPMGGYLKTTRLLPGMHLHKGEVIATVEDQQYIQLQQDYLTAQARFGFLESEFSRQEKLNASKATSDKVFQQTRADYTSQQVLVRSLQEKLRLIGIKPEKLNAGSLSRSIHIFSPIDGFVTKVNVNIGKYVNPSDVLFELVDPTDIHLALTIFEKDISKLFIGQELIAYSNDHPEKKYLCTIMLIGKDLGSERNLAVHCHFKQYDKTLIPGMFMNAEIRVSSDSAMVLPEQAVVHFANKDYVFLMKSNHQFERLEVKTGVTDNGFTAIEFSDVDRFRQQSFVVNGAYSLLMKMQNTEAEE